ncbi:MAG: GNAT family N-acetyltransferase [Actinomycetota bacterium]|nr:GNAT family N-acetyltransferase [Actinomycetota bacterium]
MSVEFREATADDAPAIAKLHADSWRRHYRGAYSDEYLDHDVFDERDAAWRKRLSEPAENQFVLVAEGDSELVGFACAYGADDERWGTLLDNIHVRAERQSGGLGARLVAEVVDWCRAKYPDRGLYLWVLEMNVRAQAFYERLGGRDVGAVLWEPSPGGGEAVPIHRYAWDAPVELRQ